jgi:hypothetical protein
MRGPWTILLALALTTASAVLAAAQPDLTGVWSIAKPVERLTTLKGEPPPLRPEAKTVYQAHQAAAARGDFSFDTVTRCLPPGLPRLLLMREPFEILQRPKVIYFVHQLNRMPRRAYLDEKLPEDVDPHYLGYSVARWEGDALVIESSGFDNSTLLDSSGLPHSEALHLTERYELMKDGKHLRARFTIDDPMTFTQPWSAQAEYVKKVGYEIPEEVCAATPPAQRPRT